MSNPNPSTMVGRDELAALLGASSNTDILSTVDTKPTLPGQPHSRQDDDVSKMDRSQAAALVAKQFAANKSSNQEGVVRHRAKKRTMQLELLAGEMQSREREEEATEDVGAYEQKEEEEFAIRRKRKKTEATVLLRKGDAVDEKKRHDSSDSSSGSDSSSESSTRHRRRRGRRSRSSSSSESEDSADRRRRRLRERGKASGLQQPSVGNMKAEPRKNQQEESHDSPSSGEKNKVFERTKPIDEKIISTGKKQHGRGRSRSRSPSSGSSSSSSDDSSTSSTSSSSDSSQSDQPLPTTVSKPLFVPKSKRGTIAALEVQQQKLEDVEERKLKEKEKRTLQSRALVVEAVSIAEKNNTSSAGVGDEEEFDSQSIPDDRDPTSPELVQAERDAWEVRELTRILRDIDKTAEEEIERAELERRRNMKDEDIKDESYRVPGEARRKNDGSKYLQRYHHRGAFYMDDDTLEQAGEYDVRHRAAEYSRAATGEDKIDKAALPEVMQVKKFGFAGYSTKYKGLAKEDTTDKKLDFLPIRSAGRGRERRDGSGRVNDR